METATPIQDVPRQVVNAPKRGILVKKGRRFARLQKRYFLLEEEIGLLTYFKSPYRRTCKKVFLGACTIGESSKPLILEPGKRTFSFVVRRADKRSFSIVTEDAAELESLRRAFEQASKVSSSPFLERKSNVMTDVGRGVAWVVKGPLKLSKGVVSGLERIGDGVRKTPDVVFRSPHEKSARSAPADFAQGLSQGSMSAIGEIFGAVAGLVIEPVKGMRRRGVKGATVGLGKGVLGLVCKPVAGTIDLLTQTARGVQNTPQTIYNKIFKGKDKHEDGEKLQPEAVEEVDIVEEADEEEDEELPPDLANLDEAAKERMLRAQEELERLQMALSAQAYALQMKEQELAKMRSQRQSIKQHVENVVGKLRDDSHSEEEHGNTTARRTTTVGKIKVGKNFQSLELYGQDVLSEDDEDEELPENEMTAEQLALKRSLENLIAILESDEAEETITNIPMAVVREESKQEEAAEHPRKTRNQRAESRSEPDDDLDAYHSAEEDDMVALSAAAEPEADTHAEVDHDNSGSEAELTQTYPSSVPLVEPMSALSVSPVPSDSTPSMGATVSLMELENRAAFEKINAWQLPREKDDYRMPGSYSEGGIACEQPDVVKKIRNVGKDMIKQIGRKILSGKLNLTAVSFPIHAMKPASALQQIANHSGYMPLYLKLAAETTDYVERMKYVVCSFVSTWYIQTAFLKPLNPILGETFECYLPDGTQLYLEQTSHHPPVSHWQFVGPNNTFTASGFSIYSAHAGLNKITLTNSGKRAVYFQDGSKITFNSAIDMWTGTFMGTLRQEAAGTIEFVDADHDITCSLRLGQVKRKPSDYFNGDIKVGGQNVSTVYGTYVGYCEFDGVRYWDYRSTPCFEPVPVVSPLPSDALRRPDLKLMLTDNVKEAQAAKEDLENMQRLDAKLRAKLSKKKNH
eukprot:GILK01004974.1.p1 GENE.GILK01004974.1~~GILK01004974.1.p1  ORF type:complete len:916 (+),score=174.71 GILK01004974.1:170-2917(+)